MKTLVLIYWTRLALGIFAAAVSALVATALDENSISTFINGLTLALVVYLASYYILKAKFGKMVEKPSKIMSTGIGIYFFTWAVFFILISSVLRGVL